MVATGVLALASAVRRAVLLAVLTALFSGATASVALELFDLRHGARAAEPCAASCPVLGDRARGEVERLEREGRTCSDRPALDAVVVVQGPTGATSVASHADAVRLAAGPGHRFVFCR